jgi:hypothetical protein
MKKELYAYLTSERFIHDMLLKRCEKVINRVRSDWAAGDKPFPMLLTWPAETVKASGGEPINEACVCAIGADRSRWPSTMRNMIARTKAYGLLLVEPREREVHLLFESMHGTRAWTIPVSRHGDVSVLGEAQYADDTETFGLLWNRAKASS